MKAHIVIGSSFGDEGKGLTTDWLAAQHENSIVVRHNGGAQAGHTVELENGTRHVFQHLGSGTFAKRPTLLSRFFIVNPMRLMTEIINLPSGYINQFYEGNALYIEKDAPVSTHFDILINQAIEKKRGNERHGSCGMGINETIKRGEAGFGITYQDCLDLVSFRTRLYEIKTKYVPQRCKELGVELDEMDMDDALVEGWIKLTYQMLNVSKVGHISMILNYDHVIFEGAQGLLLDAEHEYFPHVTNSRTGIRNAVELLKTVGEHQADVYYVTRSYLTRHGNGPLPFEVDGPIYEGLDDKTNFDNRHQGHLRYAPLNFNLLEDAIGADIRSVEDFTANPKLVVTCVNQLPENVKYVVHNRVVSQTKDQMLYMLKNNKVLACREVYFSDTPTRESVRRVG
jgi:adenylosuccinate synthase